MNLKIIVPALFLLVAAISVSPIGVAVGDRVKEATQEIGMFLSGEQNDSSVGGRLVMWDMAIDVWGEHPVIGTGLGDFDQEIELRQSQGIYESIAVHASVHNIYLQALATTGLFGFVILCFALIVQPLRIFYCSAAEPLNSAKLAGVMVFVVCSLFGFTESLILRAPLVAMYLLYLATLSATVSRQIVSEKTRP